jgi:hypothetical protein
MLGRPTHVCALFVDQFAYHFSRRAHQHHSGREALPLGYQTVGSDDRLGPDVTSFRITAPIPTSPTDWFWPLWRAIHNGHSAQLCTVARRRPDKRATGSTPRCP